MKAFVENRFGLVLLVLIALGALYGVAHVTRPAPARPPVAQPRKVAVESVRTVCPAPRGDKVSVLGTGPTKVGSATVDGRGTLWRKTVKDTGPLVVSGAGGLEAGHGARVTKGDERGLSGVRCTEPAATTWLVGPGPSAAKVVLHLANADSAPAVAEILLYSGEGTVATDAATGIVIKPGEHRDIDLKTLAPSATVLAVGVTTTGGRLAVSARASLDGRGVDWLPTSTPPATRVVVPGVPAGAGRRDLLVAAPGETDAVVRVQAVTEDGAYAMKGRETVEVPAGSVAALELTSGLDGLAAALVLTSEVPVVAGVVIAGPGERQDVAFTAGTAPLDLGSTVADNGEGSKLVLTALNGPGSVRVQIMPDKGKPPAAFTVDLPASRTRNVKLKAKGPFAVVVTPVSGQVYGGRVTAERLKSGLLITARPLAPARTWAMLPTLTGSPAVVLP